MTIDGSATYDKQKVGPESVPLPSPVTINVRGVKDSLGGVFMWEQIRQVRREAYLAGIQGFDNINLPEPVRVPAGGSIQTVGGLFMWNQIRKMRTDAYAAGGRDRALGWVLKQA